MYEVGLDLRIKGGKIVFSYRAKEYEIMSHPAEPCTYICQDGEILHELRLGFETSQIEKMIIKDKEFMGVNGHMIGRDILLEVFAATIDDGRKELDFPYAEGLAMKRRERRERQQELNDACYHAERKERIAQSQARKSATSDVIEKLGGRTRQFVYRGENVRDFYLVFSKAHEPGDYNPWAYGTDAKDPDKPLGVIIVAKDYDGAWIAFRRYFLDWKIVFAPVAAQFVKGFNDPHWKVLKDNTNVEVSGYKYVIYERPDGRIVADTYHTELDIAASRDEYLKMSEEQVRDMCYASEMGRAR